MLNMCLTCVRHEEKRANRMCFPSSSYKALKLLSFPSKWAVSNPKQFNLKSGPFDQRDAATIAVVAFFFVVACVCVCVVWSHRASHRESPSPSALAFSNKQRIQRRITEGVKSIAAGLPGMAIDYESVLASRTPRWRKGEG